MTAGPQEEEERIVPGARDKSDTAKCRCHRAWRNEECPNDREKNKKLEEEAKKQAVEIKSLKAQLLDAQQENQKLKGGIFGMTLEPAKVLI